MSDLSDELKDAILRRASELGDEIYVELSSLSEELKGEGFSDSQILLILSAVTVTFSEDMNDLIDLLREPRILFGNPSAKTPEGILKSPYVSPYSWEEK